MLASIVIVTYGQRAMTERCLQSLEECLGDRLGREFELVLVDNASPDDTPALLERWSDRARVLPLPENRNFAGGCNAGAAVARGGVLVFLNNDTEVTKEVLPVLVEQALEPGVAAAGCRLLFPDGTIQHAGVLFLHHPGFDAAMPQHIFHHQDGELAAARGSWEADCVTAACLAVRTESFRAVGGFDEAFRNGLEDVDLCLRLRVAGGRIVYRGDLTVIHHEGASRGQGEALWASPERLAAMRHNDRCFLQRWRWNLEQDDAVAAELWDAELELVPPQRIDVPADLVIIGQPGGLGSAADEARAMLEALSGRGRTPAVIDSPPAMVMPRLREPVAGLLDAARRRKPLSGSPRLFVPSGAHDPHELVSPSILRLGQAAAAVRVERADEIWVSCASVADVLIAGGVRAERVHVVPSPLGPVPLGAGGAGVLVILPVHEPVRSRAILDGLGSISASAPVRLLPTALTRGLQADLAAALPRAELLPPCSDERRFASIAATADVVVAGDSADLFERPALLAAASGAAVVTFRPDGPAVSFAGAAPTSVEALGATVDDLLAVADDRHRRAARVTSACRPERSRLGSLLIGANTVSEAAC